MIVANGDSITLVASNLPPMPVSIIAISTFCSANQAKAIAVVTSKNVVCSFSISGINLEAKRAISSLGIHSPFILILSLNKRI